MLHGTDIPTRCNMAKAGCLIATCEHDMEGENYISEMASPTILKCAIFHPHDLYRDLDHYHGHEAPLTLFQYVTDWFLRST